jgi:inorganic triphosphatase YgiF
VPLARRASAVALVAFLLAGCGSSSTDTVTVKKPAASAAARAAFVAKADVICGKLKDAEAPLEARAAALEEASESASRRTALASVMRRAVSMARSANARLAAIPRPPGSEPTVAKLLAGYSEEANELAKLADAIEAVDGPGIQSARANLAKAKASGRELGQQVGLKVCGRRIG